MDKTVIELFAGVGGFRLGLAKSDFKTVWANQWEPSTNLQHAYEVYISNFGKENTSNEDINKVNKSQIPNHSLLVGGFPCQDYSVARTKAEGIKGKKGVLWWSIEEILKVKRPPFFLLENVDRLIKSPSNQKGRDFGVMLKSVNDLGYSLEWRIINSADYGFPQRRIRVFLFGAHNLTNYYKKIKAQPTNKTILESGFFSDIFPAKKSEKKINNKEAVNFNDFDDLLDVSTSFSYNFSNSGIMIKGNLETMDLNPIKVDETPLKSILEEIVNENLFIGNSIEKIEKFRQLKGAKKINRIDKNGFSYTYSEGAMSFPDDINRPARTILTSESSINRSTHVINDRKTGKLRLLSPVECERLNGFPDNWTTPNNLNISISNRKRYFFMGNALVVGLVEKMGDKISKIISLEN